MGLFDFMRRGPIQVEQRDQSVAAFLTDRYARGSDSGVNVTPETALTAPAVFRCVSLISNTMSTVDLQLFEQTANGKMAITDHPVSHLVSVAPNPEQTAPQFWSTMWAHHELRGNAYAEIVRDRGGAPLELRILMPNQMEVGRDKGEKFYKYTLANGASYVQAGGHPAHV